MWNHLENCSDRGIQFVAKCLGIKKVNRKKNLVRGLARRKITQMGFQYSHDLIATQLGDLSDERLAQMEEVLAFYRPLPTYLDEAGHWQFAYK
jgi:hypothetical protein